MTRLPLSQSDSGRSLVELEAHPAGEQRDDERVEADALRLGLLGEPGVEGGREADDELAADGHSANSTTGSIDIASTTSDTTRMSATQTIKPFSIDFGWGLGSWQDLTDDGYQRLAREYRRMIEDHELGDPIAMPIAIVKSRLARVEQVIETRAALAECWHAEDFGTRSTADFEIDVTTGVRTPLTEKGPSYGLACLFDYERHLRGESTVLAWREEASRAA